MTPAQAENAEKDRRAVARFLAGETEAFAELVERHKDAVLCFVRAYADGWEDVDDLAQEVFVEVHRSLPGFRGDALFGTWLYSVARNVCRHRLRARLALRRRRTDAPDEAWLDVPDGLPGHEVRLEDEESRTQVREALGALPPGHRAVLTLSYWEGLPYAEIARLLGIPEGTVKSRAHNAVVMLAERLMPLLRPEER